MGNDIDQFKSELTKLNPGINSLGDSPTKILKLAKDQKMMLPKEGRTLLDIYQKIQEDPKSKDVLNLLMGHYLYHFSWAGGLLKIYQDQSFGGILRQIKPEITEKDLQFKVRVLELVNKKNINSLIDYLSTTIKNRFNNDRNKLHDKLVELFSQPQIDQIKPFIKQFYEQYSFTKTNNFREALNLLRGKSTPKELSDKDSFSQKVDELYNYWESQFPSIISQSLTADGLYDIISKRENVTQNQDIQLPEPLRFCKMLNSIDNADNVYSVKDPDRQLGAFKDNGKTDAFESEPSLVIVLESVQHELAAIDSHQTDKSSSITELINNSPDPCLVFKNTAVEDLLGTNILPVALHIDEDGGLAETMKNENKEFVSKTVEATLKYLEQYRQLIQQVKNPCFEQQIKLRLPNSPMVTPENFFSKSSTQRPMPIIMGDELSKLNLIEFFEAEDKQPFLNKISEDIKQTTQYRFASNEKKLSMLRVYLSNAFKTFNLANKEINECLEKQSFSKEKIRDEKKLLLKFLSIPENIENEYETSDTRTDLFYMLEHYKQLPEGITKEDVESYQKNLVFKNKIETLVKQTLPNIPFKNTGLYQYLNSLREKDSKNFDNFLETQFDLLFTYKEFEQYSPFLDAFFEIQGKDNRTLKTLLSTEQDPISDIRAREEQMLEQKYKNQFLNFFNKLPQEKQTKLQGFKFHIENILKEHISTHQKHLLEKIAENASSPSVNENQLLTDIQAFLKDYQMPHRLGVFSLKKSRQDQKIYIVMKENTFTNKIKKILSYPGQPSWNKLDWIEQFCKQYAPNKINDLRTTEKQFLDQIIENVTRLSKGNPCAKRLAENLNIYKIQKYPLLNETNYQTISNLFKDAINASQNNNMLAKILSPFNKTNQFAQALKQEFDKFKRLHIREASAPSISQSPSFRP